MSVLILMIQLEIDLGVVTHVNLVQCLESSLKKGTSLHLAKKELNFFIVPSL